MEWQCWTPGWGSRRTRLRRFKGRVTDLVGAVVVAIFFMSVPRRKPIRIMCIQLVTPPVVTKVWNWAEPSCKRALVASFSLARIGTLLARRKSKVPLWNWKLATYPVVGSGSELWMSLYEQWGARKLRLLSFPAKLCHITWQPWHVKCPFVP
jgi:hypothetical protein